MQWTKDKTTNFYLLQNVISIIKCSTKKKADDALKLKKQKKNKYRGSLKADKYRSIPRPAHHRVTTAYNNTLQNCLKINT